MISTIAQYYYIKCCLIWKYTSHLVVEGDVVYYKLEHESLEKEESVLIEIISSLKNEDGSIELIISRKKYCCLKFLKAKK
uniref:Uncharacterized protein n=2 Tax=Physcomitrium patens TaxID=3218 RepID=A0A2K1KJB1_PHYPA|nr:hypothetical protein PHYPA_007541 [Physcomitrium patens]